MKFRSALLSATMLALPVVASAQPITGLYIGAGAGVNVMAGENVQFARSPFAGNSKLDTHFGPAGYMSFGYGFGNGLRAEVEGDVMQNSPNSYGGASSVAGQELKYGGMFNVLYDFVGLTPYVTPYIGAGVGYQEEQAHNWRLVAPTGASLQTGSSAEGSFAYQGIVGVAFPVSPAMAFTLDYRFMGLTGNRNYDATVFAPGIGTTPASIKSTNNYNNMALVGFRYAFNAAPPPPMAPPPAAVAPSPVSRSYLVFFDWDKADLTDRARQIVSEAAANSTKVQYTQIEVNGYTDTSGTPKYNQGLSVRRAKAVAAELVKDGVPANAIAIQGFGETHLLVPTGPGVREPQNRRVEIIIK
jgi:OmpA-OmpF porin, OOP family